MDPTTPFILTRFAFVLLFWTPFELRGGGRTGRGGSGGLGWEKRRDVGLESERDEIVERFEMFDLDRLCIELFRLDDVDILFLSIAEVEFVFPGPHIPLPSLFTVDPRVADNFGTTFGFTVFGFDNARIRSLTPFLLLSTSIFKTGMRDWLSRFTFSMLSFPKRLPIGCASLMDKISVRVEARRGEDGIRVCC